MIKVVTALKKRKEIWFPDEPTFVACSKRLNEPDAMRKIMDDEERLFDSGEKRSYIVEERESLMDWQISMCARLMA